MMPAKKTAGIMPIQAGTRLQHGANSRATQAARQPTAVGYIYIRVSPSYHTAKGRLVNKNKRIPTSTQEEKTFIIKRIPWNFQVGAPR